MQRSRRGEQEHHDRSRSGFWTRRRLLAAAGGLVVGAVSGFEAATKLGSAPASADSPRSPFHSRPDLAPQRVTVLVPAYGVAPGYVLVTGGVKGGQQGLLIVDNSGEPVWYRASAGKSVANLTVQRYRGKPVLTWWEGKITAGHGLGEYVLMDTSYREIKRVRAGHGLQGDLHEFLVTPAGTALFTVYQPVAADLTAVRGLRQSVLLDSIVQEVDISTGRVLLEWHARDHVQLTESYENYSGGHYDHFHVNSIDIDHDGHLLVSARHTWTVYKVHRRSGQIIWRLGGKKSDFALGPGVRFAWQHDARHQPDGTITLFDNGDGPRKVESQSRGLRLIVDERTRTARLARAYVHRGYLTEAMGSTQRLPDGGTFVGWGTVPGFSEFTPDGTLRYDARLAGPSYRAYRHPWQGRPSAPPDLAVSSPGGRRTAYVSWNGATTVRHWRLNTGDSRTDLRPARTVLRGGFETAIPITPGSSYLNVEALGPGGRMLARSRTLRA
jgi:hypothetical protein